MKKATWVITLILGVSGCSRPVNTTATVSQPSPFMSCNPVEIRVGKLGRGGFIAQTATLTNTSDRELIVAALRTSCPCVQMPLPLVCPPASVTRFEISLDLSKETQFSGGLLIDCEAQDQEGATIATFKVIADVVK